MWSSGFQESTSLVYLKQPPLLQDRINTNPKLTIAASKISALDHEVLDDAMELGALVMSLLVSNGQLLKVIRGLGHTAAKQTDLDSAHGLASDRHIKVHDIRHLERQNPCQSESSRDRRYHFMVYLPYRGSIGRLRAVKSQDHGYGGR